MLARLSRQLLLHSRFSTTSSGPTACAAPVHKLRFSSVKDSKFYLGTRSSVQFSGVPGPNSFVPNCAPPSSVIQVRHQLFPRAMATATPLLPEKRKSNLRIGTHNGTFHCDEALGCAIIRHTEKYKDAEIIRTRDEKVLADLDAVLDVGGVYDPERDRFDHHQKGFTHVFGGPFNTKLSSAGLVYKHYGREVVAKIMGVPQDDPTVEPVYMQMYRSFMEGVDAVDNGVKQFDTDAPPRYQNNTHLSARVAHLNPDWLDTVTPEMEFERFQQAMALTGAEFEERVSYFARSWMPARAIVSRCLANAPTYGATGEIMLLDQFCPWAEHLFQLEQEMPTPSNVKYVIFEDDRAHQYRIRAVSVTPSSFECRKALPAAWRGLRDAELSEASGIPGGVFVHISGFIGGNMTKEGALAMAAKALELD